MNVRRRRRLVVAAPVIISAVAHGLLAHRAAAVFTIGADWEAYNAVPGGLVGGGNASLSADQPNASWLVAAPQSTRTVGNVTNLKSISIQVSSSSPVGAPSANTFADGEAVVRDDNFFFLSQRPDLESAAGIMRVTLWCHGGYVSRQDQLASTTTSSTHAEWQASAALDDRIVAMTGSSGVDGALTGSAPETTLIGDIPFTFDRGEPTIFSFYASAAVGSVRAADATTRSIANVNLTAVFGGLQFFDAAGAPLVPNRDFLFLHSQFRGGNDEFSWITPAPEPAAPLLALATLLIPPRRVAAVIENSCAGGASMRSASGDVGGALVWSPLAVGEGSGEGVSAGETCSQNAHPLTPALSQRERGQDVKRNATRCNVWAEKSLN